MKLKDKEGNRYELGRDGYFWLHLKKKPKSEETVQHRIIANVDDGIYYSTPLAWSKKNSCWYLVKFPMLKTGTFGIRMLHFDLEDGKGKRWEGFVHPRTLTKRKEHQGHKEHLSLLPEDMKDTFTKALRVAKELYE